MARRPLTKPRKVASQERARATDGELPEEQDRGDEIVQHQRRLVDRDERGRWGERLLREGRGGEEHDGRDDDDHAREAPVAVVRRVLGESR